MILQCPSWSAKRSGCSNVTAVGLVYHQRWVSQFCFFSRLLGCRPPSCLPTKLGSWSSHCVDLVVLNKHVTVEVIHNSVACLHLDETELWVYHYHRTYLKFLVFVCCLLLLLPFCWYWCHYSTYRICNYLSLAWQTQYKQQEALEMLYNNFPMRYYCRPCVWCDDWPSLINYFMCNYKLLQMYSINHF